jgi:hypothetical protein
VSNNEAVRVSRIGWPRARGETGCWLSVEVLEDYREVRLYDPWGDVGAGDTPRV